LTKTKIKIAFERLEEIFDTKFGTPESDEVDIRAYD
jgi:hypothetical protein